MHTPLDLPPPDPEALAHSLVVADLIREEIELNQGWISFARYMELALYAPGLGYYTSCSEKFGPRGDFVTAPEMTPLFAQALARQVEEIMAESAPAILEFGAGTGRLAADLLAALAARDALPQHYDIVEISSDLQARQRQTLANTPALQNPIKWLESFPPQFSGVVLANELLDAMPVHLVTWRPQGIFERGVSLGEKGDFVFNERPASGILLNQARAIAETYPLPTDYESEVALAAPSWLKECGERLQTGALLLIDYGFPRRELYHPQRHGGTLRCHYQHRAHGNPFFMPGLQDITAHVDFTSLAFAAEESGLELYGFTGQGQFLINCELLDGLSALDPISTEYRQAAAAIHRLLLPQGMGETFKVIALGKRIDGALRGFSQGDRIFSL